MMRQVGDNYEFQGGGYSVTVRPGFIIIVKPDDWLSKYSMAIYGDLSHINEFFRMDSGGRPVPIANKNLIRAGERLLWRPPSTSPYYNLIPSAVIEMEPVVIEGKLSLANSIVLAARTKVTSQEWMYAKEKGDFGKNKNKCNQFVYDVLVEAGVKPPPFVPKYVFFSRPPTAGEWADPSVKIDGWVVVSEPKPGDVVAEPHNYSDATGHVGIVVGEKQTVSANSLVGGVITQNDWGFRGDNKPTFRRCTR